MLPEINFNASASPAIRLSLLTYLNLVSVTARVMSTRIRLVGFDSLGVRSMATFIETPDVTIFIDPAVSLAPRRYSLPPHELEWKRLEEVAKDIEKLAREADVIIITHYHYDHHDPGKHVSLSIYDNKVVIAKNHKSNINVSQRIRSSRFLKLIRERVRELRVADGAKYAFGRTVLKFSAPCPHGATSKLGYVVQVLIDDGDSKLVFTSDVEGPILKESAEFIMRSAPDIIIVDGPPTYLLGYKFGVEELREAVSNLRAIASLSTEPVIVLDHHLLRDLNYRDLFDDVMRDTPGKARIMTAAEFEGREPLLLEARRRELYGR